MFVDLDKPDFTVAGNERFILPSFEINEVFYVLFSL